MANLHDKMKRLLLVVCAILALIPLASSAQLEPRAAAGRAKRATADLLAEAEKVMRQVSSVEVGNVGQLIELVEKNNADECLTRVICELTQSGRAHGEQGVKFAQSLLKFRQSKHPKVKRYLDAMSAGAKAKSQDQCRAQFPRCEYSTQDIIAVGNKVLSRP